MTVNVICTTIPTTLTIVTPSGSGPTSLEQMRNSPMPMALSNLGPGTTTTVPVGAGVYRIVGDGVIVTADPNPTDQVQISQVSKTDPPEALKLTLTAAPFSQTQVRAFVVFGRSEDIVPPPPPPPPR